MNLRDLKLRAHLRAQGSYLGHKIRRAARAIAEEVYTRAIWPELRRHFLFFQHDQVVANADGATVRADVNNALAALFSNSSGATAPSTTIAYQWWADTTSSLLKQRNAANTGWLVRGNLAETFVVARSSNTILAAADHGRTFNCTSTFTQTLTAAATLGDGWYCKIRNNGSGVITIDPNGAETIDGAATLALSPGQACAIVCNGSAFITIGLGVAASMLTAAGDIFAASASASPQRASASPRAINLSLTFSVAANALTIALKGKDGNDPSSTNPVLIPFRNVTAATGDYTWLAVTSATSLVISSGSTLGTVNAQAFNVWIVAFNDGGTFRLGAIVCATHAAGAGSGRTMQSIYPLGSWGLASSTAEGGAGAADTAQTIYTGTAVTSKAYTVLGYGSWQTGLAAAGTWSAGPTRLELVGSSTPLPGDSVQIVSTFDGSSTTGTTTTPHDDTIPQITEGTQFLTQAITPTSAANALRIQAQLLVAPDSSLHITLALHQDAVANALAAVPNGYHGTGSEEPITLEHAMLAATTSATTFRLRAGGSGASTLTYNGSGAGRKMGGASASFLIVEEVMT